MAAAAASVVILDQLTKSLALSALSSGEKVPILDGVLSLRLARNPGGIFGLLPGAEIFFVALTAVVVTLVIVWGVRSGEYPILFGLVAGGGLGNLLDRILREPAFLRGHVVDFIELPFWPTFNIADTAISIGVVLLVLGGLRRQLK
jgi:signal peptidase II